MSKYEFPNSIAYKEAVIKEYKVELIEWLEGIQSRYDTKIMDEYDSGFYTAIDLVIEHLRGGDDT